jgi:hypothetical protein
MTSDAGNVNQKEYGDHTCDAHVEGEGGSYSATIEEHVMDTPLPDRVVNIATPMNDPHQELGFNPKGEKMDDNDKDGMQTDDHAKDEHAPASGQAAKKFAKYPKNFSEEEKKYVQAVQKFFKYSEATVKDQRANHKWPIRYMYDNLGQYEETCPKEVKKLRAMDQDQLEQLLSRINWQGAEDIRYQKNIEGVGEMHLLTVDHQEAYEKQFDLPLGLKAKLKTMIKNAEIELAKKPSRPKGEDDYCLMSAQQELLAREGAIWGWAPGQSFWENRVKPKGYNGLTIKTYYTNGNREDFISWTREFYVLLLTESEWGSVDYNAQWSGRRQ